MSRPSKWVRCALSIFLLAFFHHAVMELADVRWLFSLTSKENFNFIRATITLKNGGFHIDPRNGEWRGKFRCLPKIVGQVGALLEFNFFLFSPLNLAWSLFRGCTGVVLIHIFIQIRGKHFKAQLIENLLTQLIEIEFVEITFREDPFEHFL